MEPKDILGLHRSMALELMVGPQPARDLDKTASKPRARALSADQTPIGNRPAEKNHEVDLIRRMAGGDREAHREIYELHALPVLRYLIGRLGGNRALAEEPASGSDDRCMAGFSQLPR